jgi:hypothetical protein
VYDGRARRWAFVTSTLARPTGGNIALFELANAVSRDPADSCTLVHMPFLDGSRVEGLDDLSWFSFEPGIEHRFVEQIDPGAVPPADVVVYTMTIPASLAAATGGTPDELRKAVRAFRGRGEVAALFLQGLGVFAPEVEDTVLDVPGLKVCVGRWMVDVLRARGAPRTDVVHIPNGVDPTTFWVRRPIGGRDRRVAMNFDPHPVKGGQAGLDAMTLLRRGLDTDGIVFGTRRPEVPLPRGITFVPSPDRATIADEIYNASSIYLQPSRKEGFGMCAVESMACGCALVTTANGGSDEYAVDGETALVCGPGAEDMAEAVGRLVADEELRVRLAENGAHYVDRFRWETSAARLREAVTADSTAASEAQ